jgi:hypothetical protein
MAFKLLEMAQLRWRHLDGAQLLPLVRAGAKFADGVEVDSAKHVTQSTDNQPREAILRKQFSKHWKKPKGRIPEGLRE